MSNYDDKGLKEFKVLYNKQGGVDTFTCKTDIVDGTIIFLEIEKHLRDFGDDFSWDISSDGKSVEITKLINGKETRKYKVSIKNSSTKDKKNLVELEVEDLKESAIDRRRTKSSTKRVLLSKDVMERYAEIAFSKKERWEEIDSQKIYKVKRFLDYRSNMLIYFQFINDFLTKGIPDELDKNGEIKQLELWKLIDDDETISDKNLNQVSKNLYTYISQEIKDSQTRAENNREKNKEKEHFKEFYAFNDISEESIREDVKKFIYLYANLRHNLMHYNYSFFENLFEGKDLVIEKTKSLLSSTLDLNIFKELSNIVELREENKTNYLDDETTIRVLGKEKKAKTLHKIYSILCSRKNGFNKFINSFFSTDGIEEEFLKSEIKKDFLERLNWVEKSLIEKINNPPSDTKLKYKNDKTIENMTKEKEEKLELISLLNPQVSDYKTENFTPYYWDIHQSPSYKKLYNDRKVLVSELSKLIAIGINSDTKKRITDLNAELLKIKIKMEKITKLNSKIRLQYKLQMAFGFIYANYSKVYKEKRVLNINGFVQNFDPTKLNKEKELESRLIYLKAPYNIFEDNKSLDFNMKIVENIPVSEKSIFRIKPENNLSKFYILSYLLLPVELRGDFLGYVKHHYYGIKNVDFEEIPDIKEDKPNENSDSFFHNLRLFEKNSKKFELIKYRLVEFGNLKDHLPRIYEKFGIKPDVLEYIENSGNKDSKLFDRNILLPIMKYYQHIFKLLNDIEVHALLRFSEKDSISLDESIKECSKGKFLNFGKLLFLSRYGLEAKKDNKFKDIFNRENGLSITKDDAKTERKKYFEIFETRNKIAHLNYKQLFHDLLFDSNININKELEGIIQETKTIGLNAQTLGYNFLNDFYMRKEMFISNQKKSSMTLINNPLSKDKDTKEIGLLKLYGLSKSQPKDLILAKYKELMNLIEKTEDSILKKKDFLPVKEVSITVKKSTPNKKGIMVELPEILQIKDLNEMDLLAYASNIRGKLHKDSSDLFGIYKKLTIKELKKKLINLFIKGEKRYLNLELVNKTGYMAIYESTGLYPKSYEILNHEISFSEISMKNWYEHDFKPIFQIDGSLPNNTDYKNGVFIYTSPYEFRDKELMKKQRTVHKRDIEKTFYNENDMDYTGIYNQKIKALY